MCLIAFALHAAPNCPLLIAANRDEYLDRPTAALQRWTLNDGTEIVSGRDLRDGGTWLALSPRGRVAMLTNVRQSLAGPGVRSRGELVTRWLQSDGDADRFAGAIDPAAYGGFNLVMGDFHRRQWRWLSNRDPASPHEPRDPALHHRSLEAGVYGLSNASLDTPWPKTVRLKQAIHESLAGLRQPADAGHWMEPLTRTLVDPGPAEARDLPHTGVPDDMERALSSPFVRMPGRAYGTRSSLVVSMKPSAGGWDVRMDEWTHDPSSSEPAHIGGASHRGETLHWSVQPQKCS